MKYRITDLEANEFGVLWAALAECPAKVSFALMTKIKAQVEAQELEVMTPPSPAGSIKPPPDPPPPAPKDVVPPDGA